VRAELQYVVDGEGLFPENERQALEEQCEEFHEKYGVNIYVLTAGNEEVGGAADEDTQRYIEDYADRVYADEDAVGLIINMDIRYYYLDICGDKALSLYTDSRQEVLREKIVSAFKVNNYYGAVTDMIQQAGIYAERGPGEASSRTLTGTEFLIGLGISALASLLILLFMCSRHREQKIAHDANEYIAQGSFVLTGKQDVFQRQYVTRTKKVKSSSGGGGTTTHRSSSGRSHSGGGGHF
jgi:uncharacterized protein